MTKTIEDIIREEKEFLNWARDFSERLSNKEEGPQKEILWNEFEAMLKQSGSNIEAVISELEAMETKKSGEA